ncbi:MAG TPA: tetratricopeptide repeat protein [Thiotrichaceae bacterium]|nr:tetratricopeptide repeat protein [Thiotrichaceae bacterium]
MPQELNLHFKNAQQVTIHFAQNAPMTVDFAIPLHSQEREAIRHYLEIYAAQYVMDIDDQEAERVTKQLPQWGQKLFDAIFNNASAKQLFAHFINTPSDKYLVTLTAQTPEILSLPWELLHDAGQFLFAFQPSITILRRISPKTTFPVYASQSSLHILFVVSRPQGAGFIDPRTDAQAVLKAIENYPAITVEFLQPATLENLWQRLQNPDLPHVDVIHFDGHGYFDKTGDLVQTTIMQLSGVPRGLRKQLRDLEIGANTGYLLFERAGHYGHNGRGLFYVPTSWLSYLLSESKIRLMVLSACQSAMVAHDDEETDEEPIGSIAVGLVATSVPSVLAMSYSVMVRATELLFGGFYREIAAGESVGIALDKARQALLQDRKRRDLQRGQERVEIKVSDWFLPTLYQAGEDTPLVLRMRQKSPKFQRHNLSTLPDAGFWGRRKELWQIENGFVDGIRRVVVSGFSGQGKTFLAQELGRWLLQKAMFDAVVFVDYSGYQGLDAVQWAVTTLGSVVEQSLVDVAAANAVLQNQRILLILDNLEVYVTEKQDTLQALLTVAHQWSLLGETRVLITTRPVALGHEAYQVRDDNADFLQLKLAGLDKEEALHYFEKLLVLSDNPVRLQTEELLRWFDKVQFHPLSIGLLARSLETEDLANLEARLNQLMLELPDNPVEATLQLVIEQLDEDSRQLLPRLGVFQGGAMEKVLLDITEIPAEKWDKLRSALISTGLMQAENVYGQIYLQFHPNLITALPSESDNQDELHHRHQLYYYVFSVYLYFKDQKNSFETRAIVKRELPNLLFAVKGVLAEGTDDVMDFVDNMNYFLNLFGLQLDLEQLNQQAAQLSEEVGSQNWFLNKSSIGEQLLNAKYYTKAINIFNEILTSLGTTASYNRCLTLGRLGRCFSAYGQTEQAIAYYQQSFETAQQLEQDKDVQRQTMVLYADLADEQMSKGHYVDAQTAYEQHLAIKKQIGNNKREEAVVLGQLGNIALVQDNLVKAKKYYQTALGIFQNLHEPSSQASLWHQLGLVYKRDNQLEYAEHAYRQSANIKEAQGDLPNAADTCNNFATVMQMMGKLADAEAWYRKAIEGFKDIGVNKSKGLINLANLLQNQPNRLSEAQQLAEQALAIKKTLDPATARIWNTYHILAQIADKQSNAQEAKKNRRLAREAKANFAGTRYELKQVHSQLILAVAQGGNVEAALQRYGKGWENLKTAIQQILAGERDVDKLCEPLDFDDAPIITAILEGIERPSSLEWFEE